jgi:23S rRNA pseudouridine2457 synthase
MVTGMKNQLDYFLLNKPYGVLSQFTSEAGHQSLKDFGPFPKDVYPVGRLDADSEGLLLLTNDNQLKHKLTSPGFRHERTYLVQVEGIPAESSLQKLREGILINNSMTLPAKARMLHQEPPLPPRPIPIRFRKNVPASWIELILTEGRNRQIRKMTAAIGHPTLRLIRTHISFLSIDGLVPGQTRGLTKREVLQLIELT